MAADCIVVGGITVILKTHISFIVNKWACIQRHGLTFGMSWRLQVAHFLCLIFLQVFILHGEKNIGCTQVTSAKKLNEHLSPASQLLFESDLISSSSFSGWVNWRAVGWTHVQPSCLQGSCYNFDGPLQNHWKKKNELKLSRTNIFFFSIHSVYVSIFPDIISLFFVAVPLTIHTFFLIGWVEDKNCHFPYDWGG